METNHTNKIEFMQISESVPDLTESLAHRTKIAYGIAKRGRKNDEGITKQQFEVNKTGKANCITTVGKDSMVLDDIAIRPLTKIELYRLQGFPDNHCDILSRNKELHFWVMVGLYQL